jgi:hypothetical protein
LIKNLSPSVVKFNSTSSNLITKKVIAMPGAASGVVRFNETLTGISAGAFTINAVLFDKGWLDAIIDMMERARGKFLRDQLKKIAEAKRDAAELASGGVEKNTDAEKELRKNADDMDALADDEKFWDDDGKLKDPKGFEKKLKDEKKKLDKLHDKVGAETGKKIAEAKKELGKAAKAAGVDLSKK